MTLLYVSEHRFVKDSDGNIYTTGTMTNGYFKRYQSYFDEIILVACAEEKTESNENKIISRLGSDNGFINCKIADVNAGNFIQKGRAIKPLIKKHIKECNAVVMKVPSVNANLLVNLCRKHNKPLLFEMVSCPWDALWNYGNLSGKLIAPVMYWKTKRAVKKAPFVLYVSRDFLQSRYPTKGNSTGCSDVFLEDAAEAILAQRIEHIKKNDSKIILGTAAAVDVKYKGQQYVIQALYRLKQEGINNFEYQMIGAGKSDYLKALIKEKGLESAVVFKGCLNHNEVFDWLDKLDIYIQPSKLEGLPRALVEAMSRGLPALGTNAGGIPELLPSHCLFPKGNADQIAELIKRLTKDKMICMSKQNFAKAKEYSPAKLNNRREGFLKQFSESVI